MASNNTAPGVAAEREKFETWAREAFLQNRGNELVPHAVDHVFSRNDADHPEPGDYEDLPIHGAWTAWKARAAAGITEVAAWRHNKTHGLYDDESDVPLGDGDEWAEPLYLQPPSAAQAWKQGFQAGDDWRELVTGYYEAGNMGAPPEPPENPYTFDQFADERTASARGTAETEKAYQYTDGTLSVEREVLDALGVYARSRPEDDESWESWFQAAFDLSGERIRAVFRECKQRALASRTPAPGMAGGVGAWAAGFKAGANWTNEVSDYYEAGNFGNQPAQPPNPYLDTGATGAAPEAPIQLGAIENCLNNSLVSWHEINGKPAEPSEVESLARYLTVCVMEDASIPVVNSTAPLQSLISKWRHAAANLGLEGLASLDDCADELAAALAAPHPAPAQQAEGAEPTADAERLDWMISRGANVNWSNDHEVCNVWLPANRDGDEPRPVEGYPQKCYYDPREAIDAARAAQKGQP